MKRPLCNFNSTLTAEPIANLVLKLLRVPHTLHPLVHDTESQHVSVARQGIPCQGRDSFQSAGEAAFGKYETIDASNTEGCMPLPAKLAETRSCIFCPLFLTIFNAAQTMTTNSFGVLGPEIAKVIFIGLALYIAFLVLKYVSSMTKQDTPRFMNELLTQCFKVVVACVLLYTPDFVYSKIIGPVLDAGTELGGALLFEEGSGYTQWCSIEQNITDQTK